MKIVQFILAGLLILVVGGGALGGYYVYAQAGVETKPEVHPESIESYGANIVNSLLQDRRLEIPAEILSTLVSERSGAETACVVTDENLLKIWFTEEVKLIGPADICFSLRLGNYNRDNGEVTLDVEKIEVGALEVPGFLQPQVLSLAKRLSGDEISISQNHVRFVIPPFTADAFGTRVTVGVDTVSIEGGKMYFTLYSNM